MTNRTIREIPAREIRSGDVVMRDDRKYGVGVVVRNHRMWGLQCVEIDGCADLQSLKFWPDETVCVARNEVQF